MPTVLPVAFLLALAVSPPIFGCIPTQDPDADEWEPPGTTSMIMQMMRDTTTVYEDPPWVTAITDAPTSSATSAASTMTSTTSSTSTATSTSTSTTTTTTTTPQICLGTGNVNPANNHCYVLVNPGAFTNPDSYCVSTYAGGHAASIVDQAENDWILNYITGIRLTDPTWTSDFYVYLGGYSATGVDGTWTWTDTTMFVYSNWDLSLSYPIPGAPCLQIRVDGGPKDGLWGNNQCNFANYRILCEIPL